MAIFFLSFLHIHASRLVFRRYQKSVTTSFEKWMMPLKAVYITECIDPRWICNNGYRVFVACEMRIGTRYKREMRLLRWWTFSVQRALMPDENKRIEIAFSDKCQSSRRRHFEYLEKLYAGGNVLFSKINSDSVFGFEFHDFPFWQVNSAETGEKGYEGAKCEFRVKV